jgi:hypothetical protein
MRWASGDGVSPSAVGHGRARRGRAGLGKAGRGKAGLGKAGRGLQTAVRRAQALPTVLSGTGVVGLVMAWRGEFGSGGA